MVAMFGTGLEGPVSFLWKRKVGMQSGQTQQDWLPKVEQIAEQVCREQGCYLYDLEFVGTGKGRTLRVFVDKDGGSGIEDCSNVSKGLNEQLDGDEDLIPGGPYNLEVSTPGLDRNLRKPWHFEKVVGKKVWLKAQVPFADVGATDPKWTKAKTVESVVASADGESVTFETKEGPLKVPFAVLEKARLVFEMKKHAKK
ncbi:MAG TPA: ribosome maturation factor RimP [Pseudobdellovibrionaceae bacterium]|nr:ribosome maturation factor RimP [Pseudobdellovibrionaceae bacterium]